MAAQEDMIGLITADSGAGPKSVAPFGGRERRLGTNPLSIGIPSNLDGPVLLDMATCTVAAGKVGVARARNKSLAPGLIVDKEGNPKKATHQLIQTRFMLEVLFYRSAVPKDIKAMDCHSWSKFYLEYSQESDSVLILKTFRNAMVSSIGIMMAALSM
jgi:hypothetical protein